MSFIYCDRCWTVNEREAVRCVKCGADLTQPRGDLVERMIRALRHPLPDRRGFAAEWLGQADDDRAVVALCHITQSPEAQDDLDLLPAAAEALGKLGRASGTATLVFLARHPFLGVRAAAVRALVALGTPRARREAESVAASDPSAAVRQCAQEALREGRQHDE